MEADWSVELGPEAPALEMPWTDPEGRVVYVDLRAHPEQIENIPEAAAYPAVHEFLVRANSVESAFETAKCDVWIDAEEGFEVTHASYIDVLLSHEHREQLSELAFHEQLARKWANLLDDGEEDGAAVEIVIRRCYLQSAAPAQKSDDGFYCTLYLSATASDTVRAQETWSRALKRCAETLQRISQELSQRNFKQGSPELR